MARKRGIPEAFSVGINVSADILDVCTSADESWQCTNDAAGIYALIQRLSARNIHCIVLAANGADAGPVAAKLNAACMPASVISPSLVRVFTKSRSASIDAPTLMRIARTLDSDFSADRGLMVHAY